MIQIDMEMPEKCSECRFQSEYYQCCAKESEFCGYTVDDGKPDWCPLVNCESVSPKIKRYTNIEYWACGVCGIFLYAGSGTWFSRFTKDHRPKYCPYCGRKVRWDG